MSEPGAYPALQRVVIVLAVFGGIAALAVASMALMHGFMMTNFVC